MFMNDTNGNQERPVPSFRHSLYIEEKNYLLLLTQQK